MTIDDFTRLNNDVNGNPRYAFHFLHLINDTDAGSVSDKYAIAVKRANKIGGRKYHTKGYGGGIVIQSYNLYDDIKAIKRVKTD